MSRETISADQKVKIQNVGPLLVFQLSAHPKPPPWRGPVKREGAGAPNNEIPLSSDSAASSWRQQTRAKRLRVTEQHVQNRDLRGIARCSPACVHEHVCTSVCVFACVCFCSSTDRISVIRAGSGRLLSVELKAAQLSSFRLLSDCCRCRCSCF